MTKRLLDERKPADEYLVVFANTGAEHEETLKFVDRCDRELRFNTIWIEAHTPREMGKGSIPRVVTFETASRDGRPFEEVIAKFGIPNRNFPHCTRALKTRPITNYARSIGWKAGTYDTAIGIRIDEADRINAKAGEMRLMYPLIKWGVNKHDVLGWWKRQPFDLYVPEHLGNCTWCWKKSLRKLLTIAQQEPAAFDFPERMERTYPNAVSNKEPGPIRFFREQRTVADLKALAAAPNFVPFRDGNQSFDPELDVGDGCGESCEVHTDLVDLMSRRA